MKRVLLAGVMALALATPAFAQMKFEASILGGYTFSEGVKGDPVIIAGVGTFDSIDVKSGGSFGLSFGAVMESGGEIGFSYSRQFSELGISGASPKRVLGDMNIDSYHGYFAYNFMRESKVQPYVSIGFGATDYGSVSYSSPTRSGDVAGPVRFSTTWGFGMKAWANDKVGFRAGMVFTPTYITSEAEGWWCDPYWGCYLVGDSKYSNQFNISGGVVFRFGGN